MNFFKFMNDLFLVVWMVSPIYFLIRLDVANKKMKALLSAISWSKSNSLQMIEMETVRFLCGRGPSKIWFRAEDDSKTKFEICLEHSWIPSLPFKKYEYKTQLKSKTALQSWPASPLISFSPAIHWLQLLSLRRLSYPIKDKPVLSASAPRQKQGLAKQQKTA